MSKKIISVIMLASVLASAFAVVSTADTWNDGGTSLRPLQMISIKTIYAGVSGVANGNYNDITGYSGGVNFTPNVVGASGYTSSTIKVEVNTNPQTSITATQYYFDFVISFSSAEFDEYEVNITFGVPRNLNSNGVSDGNDTFDYSSNTKCYYEEFYNTNTRQNVIANNSTSCSINYKGSAYKLHVHLSCNTSSSMGLYYAYLQLSTVQVTKINMTKVSLGTEKEEAENQAQDNQEQAEDATDGVTSAIQNTAGALNSLSSAMSTSSTNVSNWHLPAMYIPATSVTPRINLTSEQEIDFQSWINSIPQQWMTIIKLILSISIFMFCAKEVISIVSILLNNRDSIDNVSEAWKDAKKGDDKA